MGLQKKWRARQVLSSAALGAMTAFLVSPSMAQMRPYSSGQPSFDEPEMRRHHRGMVFPNQPGRPRVGYHRHRRHRLH